MIYSSSSRYDALVKEGGMLMLFTVYFLSRAHSFFRFESESWLVDHIIKNIIISSNTILTHDGEWNPAGVMSREE